MSDDADTIKKKYPLPVYNYRVSIQTLTGGSSIASFSEVSGLTKEFEHVTYKHGWSFLMGKKVIPGMGQEIKVTLKRGIVQSRKYLQEWFDEVYGLNPYSLKRKRDIIIELMDEEGKAVIKWTVQRAMPIKMEAPTFDASSNDIAIESMELIAHGLKVDFNP
jgi:phage tail-like protein